MNTLSTSHSTLNEIDFNYDFTKLVTCGDDDVFRVWDTSTWTSFYTSSSMGSDINTCKFTYDDTIIIGMDDGRVRTFHPTSATSYPSSADQ